MTFKGTGEEERDSGPLWTQEHIGSQNLSLAGNERNQQNPERPVTQRPSGSRKQRVKLFKYRLLRSRQMCPGKQICMILKTKLQNENECCERTNTSEIKILLKIH